MSQRAVESVLGRLITDVEFRARFFADPGEACCGAELVLTARERAALLQVDLPALHDLAVRLDPRIVRAASLENTGRSQDQRAFAFVRRVVLSTNRAGRE